MVDNREVGGLDGARRDRRHGTRILGDEFLQVPDGGLKLGELKSRFVSMVSHEFRTPLGIAMSAVELLRNYLDRLPAAKREGADAVIEVQDRGIGIPEADRGRLFEAFHRATNVGQVPGTGLGLLIVKRCVDLHQGSIGFESVVGEGTTFTVRLPLFSERG